MKFIFKFLQKNLCSSNLYSISCPLFLFLFYLFIYLFLDEWGNFINRKIITWSSKERKTEIYTSAEKTANPCSKKTSYQAKLKQAQTKITKQHPILYWHFKTCSSSNSHITLNQLHDYPFLSFMDSCILKPFPIEEWIHYFYWEKLPIDTITHKGIFFFFYFFFLCKFNRNFKIIWQALSSINTKKNIQQQTTSRTPVFYVENPPMRREKPRDLVQ